MAETAPAVEPVVAGDVVDRVADSLKGERPKLLRVACYYNFWRGVAIGAAGLPVVKNVPVEAYANVLLKKVNLSELRSLDETVVGQLTTADTYVDTMKDQGLEQVKKGKNVAVEFVQNHKLYKK
mmetsp:Transcript_10489/g.31643  ORF Transcript_10489/g.31643 Transcript_10489/m.31643 type:complete len:124 (-) Transcript_10489:378-749(-)